MKQQTLRLEIDPDLGTVDAILSKPPGHTAMMVLAHGAGAGHDHRHMNELASALYEHSIGTLRFNFPYMQAGKPRTDRPETCLTTISSAVNLARRKSRAPLFLGGHSFGGRMSSHHLAEIQDERIKGLICFSFPLHNPKKPSLKRAEHLDGVSTPILFLSGSRDGMADHDLLTQAAASAKSARIHWLDTADHSYKILKRSRQSEEDVYVEAARVASAWIAEQIT